MPGAGSATYIAAAVATVNVPSTSNFTNGGFTPGALPQPTIDSVSIQNGQYFLLTAQTDVTKNGLWFADPSGPVPVMTVAQGLDPNAVVSIIAGAVGTQNGNTTWVYSATSHNGGPGFVLI